MHEKQIPMQEGNVYIQLLQVMLKVISFSILNMHEVDQMNSQFVQIFMESKFQSKLRVLDKDDVKQRLLCFLLRGNRQVFVLLLSVICVH